MSDEEKKIIVDDDWKAEAQQEKERLSREETQSPPEALPDPSFAELVNMIALQAMVGLGLVGDAAGQGMPPNLDVAKHFIDMMQVLEEKTKNNLTAEEKKLLDSVVYEMRMRFVQLAGGGAAATPPPTPTA